MSVPLTLDDLRELPDLAARRHGGTVLWADDEFYGGAEHLIADHEPGHDVDAYDARGKVYDGWETRRRREEGSDHAVLRLGTAGVVRAFVVDTAFFRGNYPPLVSLEVATVLGYPNIDELGAADWVTVADHVAVQGDTRNVVPVAPAARLATHVRLTMHPDGGVARLRVHGHVVPDPRRLGGRVDLAAAELGGRIVACSNRFYSSPSNVLAPGRASVMSDGWETSRRRDRGNDWLTVELATDARLAHAVIDTSRFVGNAPGWAALTDSDTGTVLLPRTRLLADTEHRFRLPADAPTVRRVRLDVFPDGGISRLRLLGEVAPEAREQVAKVWLGLLPDPAAVDPADLFA